MMPTMQSTKHRHFRSRRISRTGPLEGGFSLLEVMIAAMVITIAVVTLIGTLMYTDRLQQVTQTNQLVTYGIKQICETIRAYEFSEIYLAYNPSGTLGDDFDIPGLAAQSGDSDGQVGKITLYIDETATVASLDLPRDLNGDNDASDADVSTDYRLLPVKATVAWNDTWGNHTYSIYTFMVNLE